mmetsp:Transcript_41331/g.109486  ORF Transcript_41331/g.109486 Transcript_41331/m.109486 type:complete len:107 (+) Transcript_41331:2522-2842(+)
MKTTLTLAQCDFAGPRRVARGPAEKRPCFPASPEVGYPFLVESSVAETANLFFAGRGADGADAPLPSRPAESNEILCTPELARDSLCKMHGCRSAEHAHHRALFAS